MCEAQRFSLIEFSFVFSGSSTLPRATTRGTETDGIRGDKVTAATSSTSLYDNVSAANQSNQINAQGKQSNWTLFRFHPLKKTNKQINKTSKKVHCSESCNSYFIQFRIIISSSE